MWIGTMDGLVQYDRVNVSTDEPSIPDHFSLSQNYPNPFNPTTTISYQLPTDSKVELSIYDMNGHKITSLINGNIKTGYHTVNWDASSYPSGLYFYRLNAGSYSETKKMLLIK